jgi:hypothetical protein
MPADSDNAVTAKDVEDRGGGRVEPCSFDAGCNLLDAPCCSAIVSDDQASRAPEPASAASAAAGAANVDGERRAHSSWVSLNTRLQCLSKALKQACEQHDDQLCY